MLANRKKTKKVSGGPRFHGSFEYTFLATVTLVLMAIGVVMVFSASSSTAVSADGQSSGDAFFYLKRELVYAALGLVLMFGLARYDFTRLRKVAMTLMAIAIGLLVLVLIAGTSAKGATRWLGVGSLTFQPSELAKIAIVIYTASVLYARPRLLRDLKTLFLPILGFPLVASLLILAQPDLGTAITIVLTLAGMLLIGGARLRHIAILGGSAGVLGFAFVAMAPYRMARMTAFLNPYADPQESGFQIIQSLVALGSGGLFGVGVGQSVQKFNYLPEAHTDMILSIVGEETGLMGVILVVSLYAAIAYIGFRIALKCDNLLGKYLAAGITSLLVSQAAVNLCAVTGLLPLTGIPLPIISYGGTSLVIILASIGILLNIAVNPRGKIAAAPQKKISGTPSGDRGGRNSGPSRTGLGRRRSANG
jgi:cell division protein FtsW